MAWLNQISIQGFRRLKSIDLELRPLTVLIGPNGAGKTSFLQAFLMLSSLTERGHLRKQISAMGGINSILTRGREIAQINKLAFGLTCKLPNQTPIKYDIEIEPQGQSYSISREVVRTDDSPSMDTTINRHDVYDEIYTPNNTPQRIAIDSGDSFLSRFRADGVKHVPTDFADALASISYYAAGNFSTASRSPVRVPQQMRPVSTPSVSGEDLVPFLYYLRETDEGRFRLIQDTLEAAFPGFTRLEFPPVAAGTISMQWREGNTVFYPHELSDGVLRFLWLVSLLQSKDPAMLLLDEVEISLHPDLLRILVDLMRETSSRMQLVIATQSERLVRFLEPKEAVICDLIDGTAQMKWADTLDLDRWLEEYGLDELWRMGRLGGQAT